MDTSIEKQTEINEWAYNSKRDALFFFQLVFIGLSVLIFMYSLSKAGILSDMLVLYAMIFVVVVLSLVWYTKYSYTRNNRDSHHWNKIVFSEDGKKPSTLSPTVLNSVATATASDCAAKGTDTTTHTKKHRSGSASGSTSSTNDRWGYNDWSGSNPEDISKKDLNSFFIAQGLNYNSINEGRADAPSTGKSIADIVDFCQKNPVAYDPVVGLPCKQIWCMANPTLSWKDPESSISTPCKTIFPNL